MAQCCLPNLKGVKGGLLPRCSWKAFFKSLTVLRSGCIMWKNSLFYYSCQSCAKQHASRSVRKAQKRCFEVRWALPGLHRSMMCLFEQPVPMQQRMVSVILQSSWHSFERGLVRFAGDQSVHPWLEMRAAWNFHIQKHSNIQSQLWGIESNSRRMWPPSAHSSAVLHTLVSVAGHTARATKVANVFRVPMKQHAAQEVWLNILC